MIFLAGDTSTNDVMVQWGAPGLSPVLGMLDGQTVQWGGLPPTGLAGRCTAQMRLSQESRDAGVHAGRRRWERGTEMCRIVRWAENRCGCCPRLSTNFANWITLRGLWVSSLTRWTDKAGQSLALRWNATLRERGIPSPRVLLSEWPYGFTTGMCSCRKPETYHNKPADLAGLADWIGWSQFVRLGD